MFDVDMRKLATQYLEGARARLAEKIDADAVMVVSGSQHGISIRMVRDFDLHNAVPSFDHIPTEEGRAASRRLWVAAYGEPSRFTMRFDVIYGIGAIRPNLTAKVVS